MCIAGYAFRGVIIQKFSERSPLLYNTVGWYIHFACSSYLLYLWLEGFGWSFKKGSNLNLLRELVPRLIFTVSILLLALRV